MNITIIGSGNMAKGIATRALSGGHSVNLHVKEIEKGEALANDLKPSITGTVTVSVLESGSEADHIVVLATPYTEVESIAKQYDGFKGKTLIDITNPVDFNTFQLIPEAGTSGAEAIAALVPDAHIVKAFNTVFAGTLLTGEVAGNVIDVFVAGDDAESKNAVSKFVTTSGLRPVDVGPLANSRHLEGLGLIHMSVQEQLGTNWGSSIKIVG
jgi:predicted dinucleotide-binding enzyme